MKAHNSLADLPWSTIDWSRSNIAIAAHLGCSHFTAAHYRSIHAPRTVKPRIPWETVTGWEEKSNAAIAAELGVSRARVEAYRRKCKLPYGPRSPGTGLHCRATRKIKPLTLHARAARLDAIWAYLWPDDPQNLRRLHEVVAIQNRVDALRSAIRVLEKELSNEYTTKP